MLTLILSSAWACEPLDLEAAKTNASTRFAEGDAPAALAVVRDSAGRLECASSLADPVTLSLLFQVGVAAAIDPAAKRDFAADAIRFGPGVACRSMLGTDTCQALDTARNAAESGPRGRVAADGEVWLDGVRLATGAERSVTPGRHLVQHYDGGARVVSRVIDVPADAPTRVGEAAATATAPPSRSPLAVPLGVTGGVLAAGGGACLAAAFFHLYADPLTITASDNALYNPLVYGGLAAVGVGAGLAVGGVLVSAGPGSLALTGTF